MSREEKGTTSNERTPESFPSNQTIHMIPIRLRELNNRAFTPYEVSIGPLHKPAVAGDGCPDELHPYKEEYLTAFTLRTNVPKEALLDIVGKMEREIRDSYNRNLAKYESNNFVGMILLDACFIIEYFLRVRHAEEWTKKDCKNDPILMDSRLSHELYIDLTKSENQIPFSVMKRIFEVTRVGLGEDKAVKYSFLEIVCHFFRTLNHQKVVPNTGRLSKDPFHFTDLIRTFIIPPANFIIWDEEEIVENTIEDVPTITRLEEAGVDFMLNQSEYIYAIDFEWHVLRRSKLILPKFSAYDTTETFFRNIMIFEERCYPSDRHVAEFMYMLSLIVRSERDVQILVNNGIIANAMGSCKAVAELIENLGKKQFMQTISPKNASVCRQLQAFGERKYNLFRAYMIRTYFKTPFHTISIFSVIFVLFLTWAQTSCSCKGQRVWFFQF